jgi:hypothetical protein
MRDSGVSRVPALKMTFIRRWRRRSLVCVWAATTGTVFAHSFEEQARRIVCCLASNETVRIDGVDALRLRAEGLENGRRRLQKNLAFNRKLEMIYLPLK